jgi:hypothetical protein
LTGSVITSPFDGWTVEDDLGPARWFAEALVPLDPGAFKVWSVVPDRYPSYARLVHPAYSQEGLGGRNAVHIRDIEHPEQQGWVGDRRFTWQTGWPESQRWRYETPTIGTLDITDLRTLTEVLHSFTGTPDDAWALIWPGWNYGWGPKLDAAPHIDVRRNPFVLLHGSLAALPPLNADTIAGPSYWWPSDRSWAVGTDLDDFCTYIAGSDPCIAALLAETRVECHGTSADALIYPKPYLPT